ncbi:rubredoxin [Arhodomonas sp. AD133]|uniref:rubredoxin n=1 Tax=Arhodomonas sp. AD133 TaxID=3415009 RepID=UPI003EB8BDE1
METNTPQQDIPAGVDNVVHEPYAQYMCTVCGWIYDEAEGLPEAGIPPGTRWQDVPEAFLCPECGETRDAFEKLEG